MVESIVETVEGFLDALAEAGIDADDLQVAVRPLRGAIKALRAERDAALARAEAAEAKVAELQSEARCPTCQGRNRETTDMVCMTCGRDYMPDDGSDESGPGTGWLRLMRAWREQAKRAQAKLDAQLEAARGRCVEILQCHEAAGHEGPHRAVAVSDSLHEWRTASEFSPDAMEWRPVAPDEGSE